MICCGRARATRRYRAETEGLGRPVSGWRARATRAEHALRGGERVERSGSAERTGVGRPSAGESGPLRDWWHAGGAAQERGSAGAGRAEREGKEVEAGWAEES